MDIDASGNISDSRYAPTSDNSGQLVVQGIGYSSSMASNAYDIPSDATNTDQPVPPGGLTTNINPIIDEAAHVDFMNILNSLISSSGDLEPFQ